MKVLFTAITSIYCLASLTAAVSLVITSGTSISTILSWETFFHVSLDGRKIVLKIIY